MKFFFTTVMTVIVAKVISFMTNNKFDIFASGLNVFELSVSLLAFVIIFYLSNKLMDKLFHLKTKE